MVLVKGFFKNPVIAFFSSLKLSAGLMVVVGIASAKATFIESDYGRVAAYDLIYAARWFEVLLFLVTVSLTLQFFKRWPYKPRGYGFMLVHIAIVVILVSSGITRYMGFEGVMPIREGQSSDYYYSDRPHLQATLGEETDSYPVRLWKPGKNNIWKNVTLGGAKYKLGVTEFWPHFVETYQPGPGGIPALQYGTSHNGDVATHTLLKGGKGTIAGIETKYLTGGFSEAMSNSPFGDLRLHVAGATCTIPVEPGSDAEHSCGGHKFRIIEFQADFKVGGAPNSVGPLLNPMIRVTITAPDGATGERMLFALHPDFSMGHGGGEDEFAGLDLLYQVNRGIEFAAGGETGLQGRASIPIRTMDMNTQEEAAYTAGEIFPIHEEVLYASPENDLSFVTVGIYDSVVLTPANSETPGAGAAAQVVIRDGAGNEAKAICREHDRPQRVTLGGQTIELSYAPVFEKLPYSLHLDDFVLQTYPGSDNPATYESWVTLTDREKGIEGKKVHIFMNNPLDHRGTKHFQSSYDPDRKGTVLTVNNDPGKLPTYFGYTLISLGFLLIMLKDLLFPTRKKTDRSLNAPKAVAAVLVVLLGAGTVGGVLAQTHDPDDGQDHSGHNHQAPTGFVQLAEPAREVAARMTIQDYRGRMKPFDTLAREMVMKIAKRSKFEGRHPVDQYLSWSLNPRYWADRSIIAVRFPGLKDLLGVDHSVKHVSYNSLFGSDGQYRISVQVQEAHRTPDRDRTKTQRKLISFDERFQLLNMTFRGFNLKMYPVPGDENDTWLAFQDVTLRLNAEQQDAYRAAFASLSRGVESGSNAMIMDGLTKTRALQEQYGAAVIPSRRVVSAELFYNRSHIFSWMMIPLLGTFFVLMPVYLWNLFRNRNARISFRNPFYTLGLAMFAFAIGGMILGYTMRWIASERIPISNGHESLLFIAISVALAGLIFELVYRMGAPGALGGLLTTIVLGVSMLSTFDPAIGPLVPVLVSYWLNIHVTIITSSYGFLGLSALIGALTLFLLMAKGQDNLKEAIITLDNANKHILITGLGLLTVGTLLGGVWANESWGRYWGWDAKETWSLITILVYAVVLHFRWIPQLRSVWLNASGSLAAIASVVMTYFGVNYFLSGLHSYAQGDAAQVPDWVFIGSGLAIALITVSGFVSRGKKWGPTPD